MNYRGPGKYVHYKGFLYDVIGLALQEDTVRKADQPEHADAGPEITFVIYRPLSPGSMLEEGAGREERFWARELGDFNAWVDNPRFTVVEGPEPERMPRFNRIDWL